MKLEGHAATLTVLMPFVVFVLCIGEPDLLDAITARVGGTEIQLQQPTGLLKDFSRVQAGIQTNLLGAHQIIRSHDTNFQILIGVLQRHEQMLQNLATNANKEVLK